MRCSARELLLVWANMSKSSWLRPDREDKVPLTLSEATSGREEQREILRRKIATHGFIIFSTQQEHETFSAESGEFCCRENPSVIPRYNFLYLEFLFKHK